MKLNNPGAGLPSLERLFIKNILLPIVRIFFTWDIALFLIKREAKIIEKIVSKVDKSLLQKKVLIERTFAIEDHSRQFSINMVCEHLVIAGMGVSSIIKKLSREQVPKNEITIEQVKPKENKENSLQDFLSFMNMYENMIKKLDKKQSKAKMRHPWFVEFNNFDWSVFMYMHTFIHRRQIEELIRVLGENND